MKLNYNIICRTLTPLSLAVIVLAFGCGTNTDWPLYGRDYSNQRFSPLKQINRENIDQLTLAWSYHTDKHGTFHTI